MDINLVIENSDNKNIYKPVISDTIKWITDIEGSAGKLEFDVVKKGSDIDINNKLALNFREGNSIKLFVDDKSVFSGFIFVKNRDKKNIISVTAFDQLRYLKNKDTYVYENMNASNLLKLICQDFNLCLGNVDDTPFIIESCIEQNTTLFDIINNAINMTYKNTGQLYVLFDDFGKISLKNICNMKLNFKIDESVIENFSCETSIDDNTYNRVKLYYSDDRKKESIVFVEEDKNSIEKYGVLQYFEKVSFDENFNIKAKTILNSHNDKSRSLSIKNALGNFDVRAGSVILVSLNIGDVILNDWFVVKKCTHNITSYNHTMDLELYNEFREI